MEANKFPVMEIAAFTGDGNGISIHLVVTVITPLIGWGLLVPASLVFAFDHEITTRREFLKWKKNSDEIIRLRDEKDRMTFEINITQAELRAAKKTLEAGQATADMLFEEFRISMDDMEKDECAVLGRGAFGQVVKATYFCTPVAVKIFGDAAPFLGRAQLSTKMMGQILSSTDEDPEDLEANFKEELLIHASIESPFVLECLGGIWDEGRTMFGLVIELAPRGAMSSFIGKGLTTTVPMLLHVAKGMAYLHSSACGVLHLDLKPENVLVSSSFRAKLGDFGVAKRMSDIFLSRFQSNKTARKPSRGSTASPAGTGRSSKSTRVAASAALNGRRVGTNTAAQMLSGMFKPLSNGGPVGTGGFADPRMLAMETPGDPECDVFSFSIVAYLCLVKKRAVDLVELKNGKVMKMHR